MTESAVILSLSKYVILTNVRISKERRHPDECQDLDLE